MPFNRTTTHRPLSNVAEVNAFGTLPIEKVGHLSCDGAAFAVATNHGVIVSQGSALALHSHDLADTKWTLPLKGRHDFVCHDDRIYVGPVGDTILCVDAASGTVISRTNRSGVGMVAAAFPDSVLIVEVEHMSRVDLASGREVWRQPLKFCYPALDRTQVYVRRTFDDEIACIDLETGAEVWRFKTPADSAGSHAQDALYIDVFGVLVDGVIVVTRRRDIYKLDRQTGKTIATGRPKGLGLPLLAAESLYQLGLDRLEQYDLRQFEDRAPLDLSWARELHNPFSTIASYCLTENALVWLTQRGRVAAVSRNTDRQLWAEDLAPALFSNGQPPIIWEKYLYVEPKRGEVALVAYRAQ